MSRDDQVSILRSKFIVRLQNMNMVPVRGQKLKTVPVKEFKNHCIYGYTYLFTNLVWWIRRSQRLLSTYHAQS